MRSSATPAQVLLVDLITNYPRVPAQIGAWGARVADALLDVSPTSQEPVYQAAGLQRLWEAHRLSGEIPDRLPVWVQVWVWGWLQHHEPTRQAIERVLLHWWPQFAHRGRDWPRWSWEAQDMALSAGWWKLARRVHGQPGFAVATRWPDESPEWRLFQAEHAVPGAEIETAASLEIWPSDGSDPEERWSINDLPQWPQWEHRLKSIRDALGQGRWQSLVSRRLILRALQAGQKEHALELGWGAWLSGPWPLVVPRAPRKEGNWPLSALLDALAEPGDLKNDALTRQVLDLVLEPALAQGRVDLWRREGSPATQWPGLRFFQRRLQAVLNTPPVANLNESTVHVSFWDRLLDHRRHLWERAWCWSGAQPSDRWQAWLEFGQYRRALTVWATLAFPPALQHALWGAPFEVERLPETVREGFFKHSWPGWVHVLNETKPGQHMTPEVRWAGVGLWRMAHRHPAWRTALLPCLLTWLACLDRQDTDWARGRARRGWDVLARWGVARLGNALEEVWNFLDHAPTQARWRQLQLKGNAERPTSARRRRS